MHRKGDLRDVYPVRRSLDLPGYFDQLCRFRGGFLERRCIHSSMRSAGQPSFTSNGGRLMMRRSVWCSTGGTRRHPVGTRMEAVRDRRARQPAGNDRLGTFTPVRVARRTGLAGAALPDRRGVLNGHRLIYRTDLRRRTLERPRLPSPRGAASALSLNCPGSVRHNAGRPDVVGGSSTRRAPPAVIETGCEHEDPNHPRPLA